MPLIAARVSAAISASAPVSVAISVSVSTSSMLPSGERNLRTYGAKRERSQDPDLTPVPCSDRSQEANPAHVKEIRAQTPEALGIRFACLFGGGTALLIALATIIAADATSPSHASLPLFFSPLLFWLLIGGAIAGVFLLGLQWRAEYRRRTYDPTWAIAFDTKFNNAEIRVARSKAARLLKDNQGKLRSVDVGLADIEDILDFFEDLGFYMDGDQITRRLSITHFGIGLSGTTQLLETTWNP